MNLAPTAEQESAVGMVRDSKVSILYGGPGCGKTFTTRLIIAWAKENNMRVIQAAPTGKAAKRMIEATAEPAATIHATLGCEMGEDGHFKFTHNKQLKLSADLLIIDESSMVTTNLMARLLEAVDFRHTRVLFVGDENQLPSVGAGAVLRDMLASGSIPSTELTIIHRNSGVIVKACHSVKNGRAYEPYRALCLDLDDPINLIHVECDTPEQTLVGVRKVMCERMPLRGFNPVDDVQVISPVNSKGILSCDNINEYIREKLNPTSGLSFTDAETVTKIGSVFRPGDKVINTKNTPITDTRGKKVNIVNGDIGRIIAVSAKRMTVQFLDPDRSVYLPANSQNIWPKIPRLKL